MSRDEQFTNSAPALGYNFNGGIKIGGYSVPLVRDGSIIYVSGQIQRVDNTLVVVGAAGTAVS